MSVYRMKTVYIVGATEALDRTVNTLGSFGIFQPDDIGKFYSDTRPFRILRQEDAYSGMISGLQKLSPSCENDKATPPSDEPDEAIAGFISEASDKLDEIAKKHAKLRTMIEKESAYAETMSKFKGLGVSVESVTGCKFASAHFGSMTSDSYEKYLHNYSGDGDFVFFQTQKVMDTCFGVYFSSAAKEDEANRVFSSLYFMPFDVGNRTGTPEEICDSIAAAVAQAKEEQKKYDAELSEYRKGLEKLCAAYYKTCVIRHEYAKIKKYIVLYKDKFLLCGWLPDKSVDGVTKVLSGIEGVEVNTESPESHGRISPPVKLKNSVLSRPYEMYVEMYGLPSYNEADPTLFVAITYTLLFGIMFGDLGQGLVIAAIGAFMWFKMKMAIGKILIPCGISGALFGLVYGSVFGFEHALDGMYRLLGFSEKPVEVMTASMTQNIVYGAVALGFVLVAAAMLMNIVTSFRSKQTGRALFSASGLAGLVFYVSLVAGLVSQLLFKIKVMTLPYIIFLIVIPLILIFFSEVLIDLTSHKKDWKPESWFNYFVQSFFEMFEVLLGYVTNTVSFLRVGAFVLVHAGMMLAVFTLAEMFSGFGYVLVIILGNVLVMVLEALLVSIQVLRLEFYEMFSRFFDGNGIPYEPVKSPYEI